MRVCIGGYGPHLHLAALNERTGAIEILSSVSTAENASFVVYEPRWRMVYTTVETGYKTGRSGAVAAYRVDADDRLTAMGSAESCGSGACHLAVDASNQALAVANYGGETATVLSLTDNGTPGAMMQCIRHTGSSVHPTRQRKAHPHATVFSPDNQFLFVCDLGIDRIVRYRLHYDDATPCERAGEIVTPPGSGPRHMLFSSDRKFVYLVNELASTVVAYRYSAADGDLEQLAELSALPAEFTGTNTCAEIQMHPSGQFVYASNRGHDSIAVFRRDPETGTLEVPHHLLALFWRHNFMQPVVGQPDSVRHLGAIEEMRGIPVLETSSRFHFSPDAVPIFLTSLNQKNEAQCAHTVQYFPADGK